MGGSIVTKGVYEGRQVISEDYLMKACQPIIRKQSENNIRIYSGDGYGYQIHVADNHIRFDGAFGQLCQLDKASNQIAVVYSSGEKVEEIIKALYTPNHHTLDQKDRTVLSSIRGYYAFEKDVTLDVDEDIQLKMESKHFIFNLNEYLHACGRHIGDVQETSHRYVTHAEWEKEKTLCLQVYYIETPSILRIDINFDEQMMYVEMKHTFHAYNYELRLV